MNDTESLLAARIAEVGGWERPGVRRPDGFRCVGYDTPDPIPLWADECRAPHRREKGSKEGPDLSDRPTLASLEEQIEKRSGLHLQLEGIRTIVVQLHTGAELRGHTIDIGRGSTRGEAIGRAWLTMFESSEQ